MAIDRDKFFNAVRENPFGGNLTQGQVDGLSFLLDVWEGYFAAGHPNDGTMFLSYCLATAYWETAQTMAPIPEYGEGSGKEYGQPTGPYGQCYYGRGYVQLTWESNYIKGQEILHETYDVECPMHRYPHRMLEHEPAALILYDGSLKGWFTGASLPMFFSTSKGIENPYDARTVINGHDKATEIAGFYDSFKAGLV